MQQEGKLGKIIFNNSENGYTVAILDTQEGSFRIAGSFAEPRTGAAYRLQGEFTIHRKYGEQFSFTSYEEILPEGEDAILEFLEAGNIRGIGPKTAKLLVEAFGEETLNVIGETPEKLLTISGIGPKSLAKISESYGESREFAAASLELRELGIEMSDAVRIYKIYGSDTVSVVKDNPYILAEDIRGINFDKADKIAAMLGIEAESSMRIESGIRFRLRDWAGSGSTLMPEVRLVEEVAETLDVSIDRVRESLRDMIFAGELEEDRVDDLPVIYLYGYYHAEQRVAHALRRIKEADVLPIRAEFDHLIEGAEEDIRRKDEGVSLSEEQVLAVKSCLDNNISIITGGPGTGKTTIINTLVRIFRFLDLNFALAAPTGRAAKRMEEASGVPAMTIHRLLEFVWSDDEETLIFGRDNENPLEQDVIIIDEASMIDLMLMDGLLDAVKDGTRLVFTGDADQLPSVGAGNVLRDMIASEYIPVIRLREIHRQDEDSGIITGSHSINEGEYPEQVSGNGFYIIGKNGEDEILAAIKDYMGGRLESAFGFIDTSSEIQVLTPTKRGALGAPNLNSVLQNIVNPAEDGEEELRIGSKTFRCGDKVMQLRNNYSAEWRTDYFKTEGEGIFNGDMGVVESIDTGDRSMVVRMDDKLVTYEGEMFEEIDLAYAITVHKSQGSEFPAVIIPAWSFPPMLMTRNLLYTAVTRGKRLVIIVGDARRVAQMIANNRGDERYTGLASRLREIDGGLL